MVSSFRQKNGYVILYDLSGHSLEDLTSRTVFI